MSHDSASVLTEVQSLPANRALLDVPVGVVHDWLPVYAGAERVLEQILKVVPRSEVFSLIDDLPENERDFLGGRDVTTSFIQRLPFARKNYRYYLPLTPLAIEQFDMRGFDIVVSSSYVVAKGVLTTPDQLHVSYVHSPIRYAWDLYFDYLEQGGLTRGVKGALARLILHYMRLYDRVTADRVDVFVANSEYVARRIFKTYRRESTVIYPPVDVESLQPVAAKDDFYLTVSRLVPYKRIDLIAAAFAHLPNRKLIIIGDGPESEKVRSIAGANVDFLGYQSNEVVQDHLQRAKAFVFAAEEDFGIVPVEAQACGTPVIGYGKGGILETVVDGETGILYYEQTPESLADAVRRFEERRDGFSLDRIRENAERFSAARFRDEFAALLNRELQAV